MRTAPVALVCLGDDDALVGRAMEVSALSHADQVAGEGCAIWCVALDRAVRHGTGALETDRGAIVSIPFPVASGSLSVGDRRLPPCRSSARSHNLVLGAEPDGLVGQPRREVRVHREPPAHESLFSNRNDASAVSSNKLVVELVPLETGEDLS